MNKISNNQISIKEAEDVLYHTYGISGTASKLPGYADYNFRIKVENKNAYILKISRPDANEDFIMFLQEILLHLEHNAPDLIAPRIISDKSGNYTAEVLDDQNNKRKIRLLNWVDGRIWVDVNPRLDDLRYSLGEACGRITSYANVKDGNVTGVRFHCVPSFVVGLERIIEVEGLGTITYDLAYGGAFYAYVDMAKNNFDFDLTLNSYRQLIQTGMDIKHEVMQVDKEILHPFEDDLSFLYGTIFIDNSKQPSGVDSRNVCIFAEGEVDRCPTGSGVSGRMAIHKARKEINFGESMSIESITGSVFKGSVVSEEDYGPFTAVIPQVEGTAYITGMQTFVIDPNDPMKKGFILR